MTGRGRSGPAALRVATWNVRNGCALDGWSSWPFRSRAAGATVAGLAADVVGLQEVHGWQLRALRRSVPRHAAVGDGRDGGRWGERCTALVGPSLRIVCHRTLWFSATPTVPGSRLPRASHPRVATLVEVEAAGARRFGVAVTHLDQRHQDNQLASVALLLGWLDEDLPWVVLGDLNAAPGSPTLDRLAAGGFRSAVPPGPGGTHHGFTGRTGGHRIDHVLVRGPWLLAGGRILHPRPGGTLPSDHWPVLADLRLR